MDGKGIGGLGGMAAGEKGEGGSERRLAVTEVAGPQSAAWAVQSETSRQPCEASGGHQTYWGMAL